MNKIIAHQYWLQLTNAGTLSIRSMALRAVDNALERYHQQPTQVHLDKLKEAFSRFKDSEQGWMKSPRNRYRAFEILTHDLNGTSTLQLSQAEQIAWKLIYDESQALLHRTFQGKTLEWRTGLASKLCSDCRDIAQESVNITRNALTLADKHPLAMAKRLFDEVVPASVRTVVAQALQELIPGFMQDLAASIAPIVGVAKSVSDTLIATATFIGNDLKLESSKLHAQQAFSTNEPALATQAILRILKRERDAAGFDLAVNASSLTAKLACAVADGGTVGNAAIGLATSAVKLLQIIRMITMDCLERQAGNKIMSSQLVTPAIFDECPIIGAYMICCVPASALMNALFEKQAVVGWTGKAEHAWKNHWTPLRETARGLIKEHRFVIHGLERHPGMLSAA